MLFNFCFLLKQVKVLFENLFTISYVCGISIYVLYYSSFIVSFIILLCAIYWQDWVYKCLLRSSRYFSFFIVKIHIGWSFSIYLHIFRCYHIVCFSTRYRLFMLRKDFRSAVIFVTIFWKLPTYIIHSVSHGKIDLILFKNFYFGMYIDCSKRVCTIKWRINIYMQHHNKLIIYYKSTCNIIINNSLIIYAIHCNYISIIDTWSISFIIRNFFYDIISNYM